MRRDVEDGDGDRCSCFVSCRVSCYCRKRVSTGSHRKRVPGNRVWRCSNLSAEIRAIEEELCACYTNVICSSCRDGHGAGNILSGERGGQRNGGRSHIKHGNGHNCCIGPVSCRVSCYRREGVTAGLHWCRVPGNGVWRRGNFGSEIRAIKDKLHSCYPNIIGGSCGDGDISGNRTCCRCGERYRRRNRVRSRGTC